MSVRRVVRLVVVSCLALGAHATASAQGLVYAVLPEYNLGGPGSTTLLEIPLSPDGQFGVPVPVAAAPGSLIEGPLITAGGQLVVWTVRPDQASPSAHRIVAFDRTTRGVTTAGPVTSLGASDPSRLRVFATIGGLVHAVTAAGAAPIPGSEGVSVIKVSDDGRRLYGFHGAPSADRWIAVVDQESGTLVRTIPLPSDASRPLVTDDEAFIYYFSGTVETWRLHKLDAVSGVEQASILLPVSGTGASFIYPGDMIVDAGRQRVLVALNWSVAALAPARSDLWTLDAATLQELSSERMGAIGGLALDVRAGRVVIFDADISTRPVPGCDGRLRAVSLATGAIEGSLNATTDLCIRFALALPPPAPVLDAPVVTGTTVGLSWSLDGLTTGLVVEAGSAPGLADLAVLPVSGGTTLTVPNVPPGTYFVRVRAENYVGPGEASNEVQITIP